MTPAPLRFAAIACLAAAAGARRPLAYIDPNNPTGQLRNPQGGGTISGVATASNTNFGGDFNSKSPPHYPGLAGQSVGFGSSQGKGDPILEGFDGRTFEFFGKVGSTYSLLSEANHQLSVRLKFAHMWDHNGTYMDAFSLQYRGHHVVVLLDASDALAVTVDGTAMALQPGQAEAEEVLGLLQGELHVHLQAHRPSLGNAVELTTDVVGLIVYVTPAGLRDEGGVEQPAYLNFDLQLLGRPEQDTMEGIVGHTYSGQVGAKASGAEAPAADKDDFEFHHSAEEFEMASFTEAGQARMLYHAPQPALTQA